MATYYRTDQSLIHLKVTGISLPDIPWDKMEGGENKSESLNVHPGGKREQVALGGVPKREPIKLSVKWQDGFIAQWKALDAVTGNGVAEAMYSVTNTNYEPTGEGATYTGIVSEVKRPNYESGKPEEALLEVTLDLNGAIG